MGIYDEGAFVPKLKETDVRDGKDIAKGAGAMAMQGAQVGQAFGPWGMAAGALTGATVGAVSGLMGQRQEKNQLATDKNMNSMHYNSMGRQLDDQRYQTLQAEHGMDNNTGQSQDIAVQKKEVVMNKNNYNMMMDTTKAGAGSHSDGTDKVIKVNPDQVVIPDETGAVKSAIKRYKLNGDKKAKAFLDRKIEEIPDVAPTGEDGNPMAKDGWKYGSIFNKGYVGDPADERVSYRTWKKGASQYGGDTSKSEYRRNYGLDLDDKAGFDKDDKAGFDKDKLSVGKWANVAYNLYQGAQPAETVERRLHGFDEIDFVDRSSQARSDINTQMNASIAAGKGSGLSAGQRHNYNAQRGAQVARNLGSLNTQQAIRADEVNMTNAQNYAQVQQANLGLSNQYDDQDAMNRAAKQAFTGKAFSEIPQISQFNTQAANMKARNEKQYEMDDLKLKYLKERFNFIMGDGSKYGYTVDDQASQDYYKSRTKQGE